MRHDRRRYLISGARILMRSKHFKVAEEVGVSIMRCVNSFSITAQNRISSASSSSSSSPRVLVQFNNAQNPLSSRPSTIDKREEAGKGCSDNDVYISFSKRTSSHTRPHTDTHTHLIKPGTCPKGIGGLFFCFVLFRKSLHHLFAPKPSDLIALS